MKKTRAVDVNFIVEADEVEQRTIRMTLYEAVHARLDRAMADAVTLLLTENLAPDRVTVRITVEGSL